MHPQSAYSAFTHGVISKWNFVFRTCPNFESFLQPLEDIIRCRFIPALFSRAAPNNTERNLFSLPCRLGGLGIPLPSSTYTHQYQSSVLITEPMVNLIISQCDTIPPNISDIQWWRKSIMQQQRCAA